MKALLFLSAMNSRINRKSRPATSLKLIFIFLLVSLLNPLPPQLKASGPAETPISLNVGATPDHSLKNYHTAIGSRIYERLFRRPATQLIADSQDDQPVTTSFQPGNCGIQPDGAVNEIRLQVPHIQQPAHSSSCGPAALTMLLNHNQPAGYGYQFPTVTQNAIDQGFYLPGDPAKIFTAPGDLAAFAQTYGVIVAEGQAETAEAGFDALRQSLQVCNPVIVDLVFNKGTASQYTHFVVVTGITWQEADQPRSPELAGENVAIHSSPILWINDPLAAKANIPYAWHDFEKMWQDNTDPWKRGYPTVNRWWMTLSSTASDFAPDPMF